MSQSITDAVILAAGRGSRLGGAAAGPKCLVSVGERPLLGWIVQALADAGVGRVHLITGHDAGLLHAALPSLALPVPVLPHRCHDWELGNGRSAAAAQESLGDADRFLLLMADHLVSAAHVATVAGAGSRAGRDCVLGTCSPHGDRIDLPDATKVEQGPEGQIHAIGKELTRFNAIDTGVFRMTQRLFTALSRASAAGDHSLTGGNRILAAEGHLFGADVGDAVWQDVDNAQDLVAARRLRSV